MQQTFQNMNAKEKEQLCISEDDSLTIASGAEHHPKTTELCRRDGRMVERSSSMQTKASKKFLGVLGDDGFTSRKHVQNEQVKVRRVRRYVSTNNRSK